MYFCKFCGAPYSSDQAVVCIHCGAPKGAGNNYCSNCGASAQPGAVVCLQCGASLNGVADPNAKSKLAAGLFGIFLGAFGVHNFYLGYIGKAVTQLVLTIVGILTSCLVVGGFVVLGIEIWGVVEGIMILCGSINKDATGRPLRE